jgi:DNA-binding response OmpR family regulator
MRVLIVEDDPDIRGLVAEIVAEERGHEAAAFASAEEAWDASQDEAFPMMVLDWMLPGGMDGLELCRRLRATPAGQNSVILVLTARSRPPDLTAVLDAGADDYLTKPFGVRELMARVRAVMRRRAAAVDVDQTLQPVTFKHIEMDPSRRRVRVHGRDVELTNQEFNLLYVLLSQPGIVFSREALLRKAWPGDTFVTVRSVDTLVKRLRRKIQDDASDPSVILTVWGTGYKAADAQS